MRLIFQITLKALIESQWANAWGAMSAVRQVFQKPAMNFIRVSCWISCLSDRFNEFSFWKSNIVLFVIIWLNVHCVFLLPVLNHFYFFLIMIWRWYCSKWCCQCVSNLCRISYCIRISDKVLDSFIVPLATDSAQHLPCLFQRCIIT